MVRRAAHQGRPNSRTGLAKGGRGPGSARAVEVVGVGAAAVGGRSGTGAGVVLVPVAFRHAGTYYGPGNPSKAIMKALR